MSVYTLLNKDFITSMLTVDDPWCSSHGSDDGSDDLSAGLIYFALAYVTRLAPTMRPDQSILVNLSGRGDKDIAAVEDRLMAGIDGGAA